MKKLELGFSIFCFIMAVADIVCLIVFNCLYIEHLLSFNVTMSLSLVSLLLNGVLFMLYYKDVF